MSGFPCVFFILFRVSPPKFPEFGVFFPAAQGLRSPPEYGMIKSKAKGGGAMRELHFTVPAEYDGLRGAAFLRGFCGLSYHTVRMLKQAERGVTANGALLRTIDRVHAGQQVTVRLPDDARPMQAPLCVPVPVAYEDADVLVFNKPPEMPIHPSHGHERDTLANAAAAYLAAKGEHCAFRPLNRLDRNTSGLAVTAKHTHAASRLSGRIDKIYLAVTEGIPAPKGTLDAPLRRREGCGIRREIGAGGEPAVTHWQVLAAGAGHALLRVVIDTGRTHQIRAHFASTGYPLAGDDMYGGSQARISRQALHCAAVRFVQPVTGAPVELFAPLPDDMARLLAGCGMPVPASETLRPFGAEWGF